MAVVHADHAGYGVSTPALPAATTAQIHKKPRSRWHFGIRSRSPPMEIMLELYRTLQSLGMEWRAKAVAIPSKSDGNDTNHAHDDEAKDKEHAGSGSGANKGEELFFLETRWKVGHVLVRMDLQLYHVDATNYLVDFRNVGYTKLDPTTLTAQDEEDKLAAAFDKAMSGRRARNEAQHRFDGTRIKPSLAPAVPAGRKE